MLAASQPSPALSHYLIYRSHTQRNATLSRYLVYSYSIYLKAACLGFRVLIGSFTDNLRTQDDAFRAASRFIDQVGPTAITASTMAASIGLKPVLQLLVPPRRPDLGVLLKNPFLHRSQGLVQIVLFTLPVDLLFSIEQGMVLLAHRGRTNFSDNDLGSYLVAFAGVVAIALLVEDAQRFDGRCAAGVLAEMLNGGVVAHVAKVCTEVEGV